MFKYKSLAVVTIFVLLLAVVAISCAPAAAPAATTPATAPAKPAQSTSTAPAATTSPASTAAPSSTTPAATPTLPAMAEKKTSFEAQKYTNSDTGFSFKYPASWKTAANPYAKAVFYANDGGSPLPDLVFVDVRPGTSVKDSAMAALKDFITAKGLDASPTVESEKTITLADGKTSATEIVLSVTVLFQSKKGYCVGAVKGGNVITVLAGIDTGRMDSYKEIVETLALQ